MFYQLIFATENTELTRERQILLASVSSVISVADWILFFNV